MFNAHPYFSLKNLDLKVHAIYSKIRYLSHARHNWQGDTPKISAHMMRTAVCAEWDHTQTGSWENSPLVIRGAKTHYQVGQRDGVHHF